MPMFGDDHLRESNHPVAARSVRTARAGRRRTGTPVRAPDAYRLAVIKTVPKRNLHKRFAATPVQR